MSTDCLPWDVDGTETTAKGGDMHARATGLAHAAMLAAASAPAGDPADSDYARSQARYQADLARIRAESARGHLAANNQRAEAARAAKAERVAAHQARNAAAAETKAQRKLDKAA